MDADLVEEKDCFPVKSADNVIVPFTLTVGDFEMNRDLEKAAEFETDGDAD